MSDSAEKNRNKMNMYTIPLSLYARIIYNKPHYARARSRAHFHNALERIPPLRYLLCAVRIVQRERALAIGAKG